MANQQSQLPRRIIKVAIALSQGIWTYTIGN